MIGAAYWRMPMLSEYNQCAKTHAQPTPGYIFAGIRTCSRCVSAAGTTHAVVHRAALTVSLVWRSGNLFPVLLCNAGPTKEL